jgi:hypothetical protein
MLENQSYSQVPPLHSLTSLAPLSVLAHTVGSATRSTTTSGLGQILAVTRPSRGGSSTAYISPRLTQIRRSLAFREAGPQSTACVGATIDRWGFRGAKLLFLLII